MKKIVIILISLSYVENGLAEGNLGVHTQASLDSSNSTSLNEEQQETSISVKERVAKMERSMNKSGSTSKYSNQSDLNNNQVGRISVSATYLHNIELNKIASKRDDELTVGDKPVSAQKTNIEFSEDAYNSPQRKKLDLELVPRIKSSLKFKKFEPVAEVVNDNAILVSQPVEEKKATEVKDNQLVQESNLISQPEATLQTLVVFDRNSSANEIETDQQVIKELQIEQDFSSKIADAHHDDEVGEVISELIDQISATSDHRLDKNQRNEIVERSLIVYKEEETKNKPGWISHFYELVKAMVMNSFGYKTNAQKTKENESVTKVEPALTAPQVKS